MIEKIAEQVIVQFPVVMLMFYLFKGREERINTLEKRMDECLDARIEENPHKYTYPPK